MSFRLTRRFRIKAALACAVLYAACVLLSSAAFAFAHGDDLLDCLTDHHVVAAAVHHHGSQLHDHAGVMAHQHESGTPPLPSGDHHKNQMATCCSIFAMVGLLGAPGFDLALVGPPSVSFPVLQDALDGRGPDLINRPPIA